MFTCVLKSSSQSHTRKGLLLLYLMWKPLQEANWILANCPGPLLAGSLSRATVIPATGLAHATLSYLGKIHSDCSDLGWNASSPERGSLSPPWIHNVAQLPHHHLHQANTTLTRFWLSSLYLAPLNFLNVFIQQFILFLPQTVSSMRGSAQHTVNLH